MNSQTRNKLLAYLAGAAASLSAGAEAFSRPGSATGRVPELLLNEILDEVEGTGWKSADRLVLLSVLARDTRAHVRTRVSEMLSECREWSLPEIEPLLRSIAADPASSVRNAAARTTAQKLSDADMLTRTRTTSEWALSDSWAVRDTIARALVRSFNCLGAASAVAHLAEDRRPEVRESIVATAAARREENPVHYEEILQRLAGDGHRRVRRAARRAETAAA